MLNWGSLVGKKPFYMVLSREESQDIDFPDDFKFMGSKTSQYKQVGNAVPPLMSKHLGQALLKKLS